MLLLISAFLMGCATNQYYDPSKPHHTPSGFRNIDFEDGRKGFGDFIKWRWQRMFKDKPAAADYDFGIDRSHHAFVKSNTEQATLTWIGHATFLLQFAGLNILTDPHFSERASPLTWAGPKRVVAPAMQVSQLPDIDAVVISHDHYDSLDLATVRALAGHNRQRSLTFLVPLGIKPWFDDLGLESVRVVELDWGQSHSFNGVTFTAEPVQHWSKRSLLDGFERLWAGWVIAADGDQIFFAGDTGYAGHFKDIGEKYRQFDLALIPIGAYEPRWFMQPYHVNPEEAVKIHLDIRSRYSVAMHWGTFILTDEPLDEPPVKLAEALDKFQLADSEFVVLQHGETRFIDELFESAE